MDLSFPCRRVPQAKIAASQAQKSREASELEVIAQKQKETHEKLKQNKVSLKKALAGQSYMPCRSAVDNLTHPKEFHFATDDRLGPSTHHTQTEQKEKDFVGTLRQHPPSPVSREYSMEIVMYRYVLLMQTLVSADAYPCLSQLVHFASALFT